MQLNVRLSRIGYGDKAVLTDLAFDAYDGELIAVIGKNGAGKSTLISALAALLPYEGEVLLDGVALDSLAPRERARRIAVLSAPPRSPHITVRELLSLGRYAHHSLLAPAEGEEALIEHAVTATALDGLADAYLDRMSSGERMRAELARLLVQEAPLWLLDEPTAFLDPEKAVGLLRLIKQACREGGKLAVAVLHELSLAMRFADRILLIDEGRGRWFSSPEELLRTDCIPEIFSLRHTVSEDGFPLFYPI